MSFDNNYNTIQHKNKQLVQNIIVDIKHQIANGTVSIELPPSYSSRGSGTLHDDDNFGDVPNHNSSLRFSSQLLDVQQQVASRSLKDAFELFQNEFSFPNNDETQRLQRYAHNVHTFVIRGYDFGSAASFPTMLESIPFPNIRFLFIDNNYQLENLSSLPSTFPLLESLRLSSCPRLTSLHSLVQNYAEISSDGRRPLVHLHTLSIINCALSFTDRTTHSKTISNSFVSQPPSLTRCQQQKEEEQLKWHNTFQTLSHSSPFLQELCIKACAKLIALPPSIHFLKRSLTSLIIKDNPNLQYLPDSMGDLISLQVLAITGNPMLRSLPSTLGRLSTPTVAAKEGPNHESYCQVCILDNTELVSPPKCFQGSLGSIRQWNTLQRLKVWRGIIRLTVLLRKAHVRAVERMYRPGGIGFDSCRERFCEMSGTTTT